MLGSKASGRKAALQVLDVMLSDARNLAQLRAAFQVEFDSDPVKFFKAFVMPLLPKDVDVKGTANVHSDTWNGILDFAAKVVDTATDAENAQYVSDEAETPQDDVE